MDNLAPKNRQRMNPVVYYHIFANPLGCAIAREQLAKIHRFIPLATIRCGIVAADAESASRLLSELRAMPNLEVIAEAETGNEWLTLTKIHEECRIRWPRKQPILYCHTKGAHSTGLHPEIVPIWREWMEYFVLFRYRDALHALENGYTAYGFDAWLNFRRKLLQRLGFGPWFFIYSGNYWWTTAGAIRRIRLEGIDMKRRHSAESEFLPKVPGIRPFDALQLIGLPSIPGGGYTNYADGFAHFPKLAEKSGVLEEMRSALAHRP